VIDPLFLLILNFEEKKVDFDELLNYYFSSKILKEWKCGSDNCEETKKSNRILLNLPRYLSIQLARFNNSGEKINHPIQFPWDNFELKALSEKGSYEIEAIVCHQGESIY
jgi:uncharacterized UBP type Zn finger protein